MHAYKYTAINPSGKRVTGEITSASSAEAERTLAEQQVFVTKIEPAGPNLVVKEGGADKERSGINRQIGKTKPPKIDDVCEMLRALSVMVESGVPVVEGLQSIVENGSTQGIQDVAKAVRSDVMGGLTLSQALSKHPRVFPQVVVDMIAVSDENGKMVETFNNVIAYLDRNSAVKKNIIASLTYPGILIGASGTAFMVLIVVILPTFHEAFGSLGVQLPWFTVRLMELGIFIKSKPLFILAGMVGGYFGIKKALRVPKVGRYVALVLYKLPIVGAIITDIARNRSLRTLGSLLSTSVPIIDAIRYASRVSGHLLLQNAWDHVAISVGNGGTVSESMAATKMFPKMVIQMVAVGERSGRVAEMITTLTEHSENQTERKIKSAVSMLEPLVIIGMGILVGMITMSILMPLFSISNNVQ